MIGILNILDISDHTQLAMKHNLKVLVKNQRVHSWKRSFHLGLHALLFHSIKLQDNNTLLVFPLKVPLDVEC